MLPGFLGFESRCKLAEGQAAVKLEDVLRDGRGAEWLLSGRMVTDFLAYVHRACPNLRLSIAQSSYGLQSRNYAAYLEVFGEKGRESVRSTAPPQHPASVDATLHESN